MEVCSLTQGKANGCSNNPSSNDGMKKQSNSRYIFMVEATGFADGFYVGKKGRGVKDDSKISGLRNWKDEVAI